MKQIQKMQQRGLLDTEREDPFSLFVASTDIRYCYYSDTHKVLGNTYGMCVLQVRRLAGGGHVARGRFSLWWVAWEVIKVGHAGVAHTVRPALCYPAHMHPPCMSSQHTYAHRTLRR